MQNITKRFATLFTFCALLGAACSPDLESQGAMPDVNDEVLVTPAELGLGGDWLALEDGLWTRADENGEQEFLGIGEPGTQHAIASLEQVEEELAQALADTQREDTREQLAEIRGVIADLRASPMTLALDSPIPRCTITITGSAFAQPISCGAGANSSALYSNGCDASAVNTIRTYASATCNGETKTHSCGPRTGNSVNCTSGTSIIGPGPCSSYSWTQLPGFSIWKHNYLRGSCGGPGATTLNDPPCGGYGQPICQ